MCLLFPSSKRSCCTTKYWHFPTRFSLGSVDTESQQDFPSGNSVGIVPTHGFHRPARVILSALDTLQSTSRRAPAMTLKRLTMQAQKSFPGFYSSDDPASRQVHEQPATAFKRLTLQMKKSLPGLYSSGNTEESQPSTCVASGILPIVHC